MVIDHVYNKDNVVVNHELIKRMCNNMTKITFNNDMGELGTRTMSTKKALHLLKTMKAADTFVFEGISIAFTECYFVVAKNADCINELFVYGEEVHNV